jgi:hypothetical protein
VGRCLFLALTSAPAAALTSAPAASELAGAVAAEAVAAAAAGAPPPPGGRAPALITSAKLQTPACARPRAFPELPEPALTDR